MSDLYAQQFVACGLTIGNCPRQIPYDMERHEQIIRTDAIDEFMTEIEKDARYEHQIDVIEVDRCRLIAKQLKEQK